MSIDVSIAITTYNEGEYHDFILSDIARQEIGDLKIEILLLEAGKYDEARAKQHLGRLSERLIFIQAPGLSRTASLNQLFEMAKGNLIVRLDARSHIDKHYFQKIYALSRDSGAENVGGVMAPIGRTSDQQLIAEIMRHPLSLGGGKSRNIAYRGYADSVYLGAFNKKKCRIDGKWFDDIHPKISEDSDLNFRLRKNGGKIFADSSIVVEHFPREDLKRIFKLCFNCGVGRGLFIIKHRVISAYRQLAPPIAALAFATLTIAGFFNILFYYAAVASLCVYLVLVIYAAVSLKKIWLKLAKRSMVLSDVICSGL